MKYNKSNANHLPVATYIANHMPEFNSLIVSGNLNSYEEASRSREKVLNWLNEAREKAINAGDNKSSSQFAEQIRKLGRVHDSPRSIYSELGTILVGIKAGLD